MAYKCFEDMPIWQAARNQHKEVIEMTTSEGFAKDFKLRDQIKAAAGSVMDNIAEGYGRGGNKEFINFLTIARGSNDETRSQCYQAYDRGYITETHLEAFIDNSKQLSNNISSFILYLQKSEYKGSKFSKL